MHSSNGTSKKGTGPAQPFVKFARCAASTVFVLLFRSDVLRAVGSFAVRASMAWFVLSSPGALADELQWLTEDGRLKHGPVFRADGVQIVYAVAESPTMMRLMRLQLEDRRTEPLHSEPSTSQLEAAFGPDEKFYAFVERSGVTRVQLVIRDTQSGGESRFDPGGDRNHLSAPSIAPDARRVAFSFPTAGGQQIVSVDMQASDLRPLTETSGINDWPVYSPDGQSIAFASSRDGDFEIYVMDADGSSPRRLTESPGMDIRPSWSPDGRRLAFTSGRDGDYEIYIVNVDDGKLIRVTNNPERDDFAIWHPDGHHLVFVSEHSGRYDLAMIDLSSSSRP